MRPARSSSKNLRFLGLAGLTGREHVGEAARGHDGHAVGVGDDPVAFVHVARRPRSSWPPTRPGCSLVAPRNAIIEENTGKPWASSALDVADAAVDHETDDAARLGAGGEHLAPVAALGLDADARDEHVTGRRLGDGDVDREVVAGRARDRIRRRADARAGPRGLDAGRHRLPAALAERRRPELRERGAVVVGHGIVAPRADPVCRFGGGRGI